VAVSLIDDPYAVIDDGLIQQFWPTQGRTRLCHVQRNSDPLTPTEVGNPFTFLTLSVSDDPALTRDPNSCVILPGDYRYEVFVHDGYNKSGYAAGIIHVSKADGVGGLPSDTF
jgi:hypothetical protein